MKEPLNATQLHQFWIRTYSKAAFTAVYPEDIRMEGCLHVAAHGVRITGCTYPTFAYALAEVPILPPDPPSGETCCTKASYILDEHLASFPVRPSIELAQGVLHLLRTEAPKEVPKHVMQCLLCGCLRHPKPLQRNTSPRPTRKMQMHRCTIHDSLD